VNIRINTVNQDRITAAAVALAAFSVYLLTLAPSVSFWDSGEYIACSWVAGIPHPPGVPFFVLLGRFSTLLFGFIPSVAFRVNLMCAVAGTATIGLAARLVQRWCSRMGYQPWLYRPVSAAGALLAAFSYTVWRNNNATETYAMASLLSMLILWVFDIWLERRQEGKPAGRQLLLTGYLMTLSIGNHLSALIVVLPIVAMYVLYAVRKKAFEWRSPGFISMFLALMVLAFSIHLYMPLRAVQNPEINETDPSVWTEFREALERKQYGQVSILSRKGPFGEQLGLYREYLSWQPGRPEAWTGAMGPAGGLLWAVFWLFLVLSTMAGFYAMGARRKDLLLLLGLTFFMASFAFVVYLNFKTGPEGTAMGEVRERDYFFGASFIFFALVSMMGMGQLLQRVRGSVRGIEKAAWGLLIFPLVSLSANWYMCDRSGDYVARDYGINLLESCPENAVIITNGDNDTFPLWFAQSVLGVRRDVIVSNLSLMNTRWYMRQLIMRDPDLLSYTPDVVEGIQPVFIWGPNFFHVTADGLPEVDQLDRAVLDQTFTGAWPWTLTREGLAVTVPEMGRGGQGSVAMQDLLLINMIRNQPVHGREIVIAGTVSSDNRSYVEDYLQMHGIAFRIMGSPVQEEVDPHSGWDLWQEYLTTGLTDPGVYKDDQAVQIARNYVSSYLRMAAQFLAMGEVELAEMSLDRAEQLFSAMRNEWISIMPNFVFLKARLLMGTDGIVASQAFLEESALYLDSVHQAAGIQSAASASAQFRAISREFAQAGLFYTLTDTMAAGGPGARWLQVEAALTFGDYVTARRIVGETAALHSADPVVSLMEKALEKATTNRSPSAGMNMMDTALAAVLARMDTQSSPLAWNSGISAQEVILDMVGMASMGNVMSAVCLGTVMADKVEFSWQGDLILDLAGHFARDPEQAARISTWYVLSAETFSPLARAVILHENGWPGLCLTLLDQETETDREEARQICLTGTSPALLLN
jgi:MFS family permease